MVLILKSFTFAPTNGLRTHFVFAWLAYWLLAVLMPVEPPSYRQIFDAIQLQLGFVVIVTLVLSLPLPPIREGINPATSTKNIERWIYLSIFLACIGLSLQLFDKLVNQEIDYLRGIAAAREQLRHLGELRTDRASSIASAIGHLIGSSHFVAMALLLHEECDIDTRRKSLIWGCVMLLLMSNLLLIGGRSGLLFTICFFFAMCARRGNCLASFGRVPFRYKAGAGAGAFLCGTYALYVFFDRAFLSEMTVHNYTLYYLPHLGMAPSAALASLNPDSLWTHLLSLLTLTGAYLTHSFYTTIAILEVPLGENAIIFVLFQSLLAKSGLISPTDTSWFLSGLFPSLPGALYHQSGVVGVIIGAALLGLIASLIAGWHLRNPSSPLSLCAYCLIYSTLVLSPLLLAADFLNFPFIVTGALTVACMTYINRRWLSRSTSS